MPDSILPEPPGRHLGGIRWLPVAALDLSTRARNALEPRNVGELLTTPVSELGGPWKLRKLELEEVRQRLAELRLRLLDGTKPNLRAPIFPPQLPPVSEATPLVIVDNLGMRRPEHGYVYFVQVEGDGPIKIGVSTGLPDNRVYSLQCACPYELRLVATFFGGRAAEAGLHRRFKHLRLRGEWFRPAPELLEWIERFATRIPDATQKALDFEE